MAVTRTVSCAIGAALAVALAGCSRADTADEPAQPAPAQGRPIAVSAPAWASPFTPMAAADETSGRVTALLFRGLVRNDAKGKPVNEMAETIETDDQRTYRIRIKDGWTFSDGEQITAQTFATTWAAAAVDRTHPGYSAHFSDFVGYRRLHSRPAAQLSPTLDGVTVGDRLTLTVTLNRPRPGFLARLGDVAFAPLPEASRRDPSGFARHPVGNGPYLLDQAASAADRIALNPNPAYLGPDRPQNSGIVLRRYPTPEHAYADLRAGRLDVVDTLPLSLAPRIRDELGVRSANQPVGVAQSLVFPMNQSQWTARRGRLFRQAVSRAIDRDGLARTVFGGTRRPATDFAAPVVEGFSQQLCGEVCRFDEVAADEQMKRAGGPLALSIAYAADTEDAYWLHAACTTITRITGADCTPVPYPSSGALSRAVGEGRVTTPFVATTRMTVADLGGFLDPRFVAGAPGNDSGYANEDVTTLIGKGADLPVGPARLDAFQDAERVLVSDLPVIPLWSVQATAGWSPAVKDVKLDVVGVPVYTEILPA